MNRRSFLIRVGGAVIAVPLVMQVAGCGDDAGSGPDAAPAASFTISSTGSAHTHQVTLLCSQLDGSVDVMLTSTVTLAHSHVVTLTASQLAQVAAGEQVIVNTSDGHVHSWVFEEPAGVC